MVGKGGGKAAGQVLDQRRQEFSHRVPLDVRLLPQYHLLHTLRGAGGRLNISGLVMGRWSGPDRAGSGRADLKIVMDWAGPRSLNL